MINYIYNICYIKNMVKTLRITDNNHKEMMKIQGEIQSRSGENTSMDTVIDELVTSYRRTHSKR